MRQTFIKTLTEMARKDKDIIVLTADVGFSVFDDFKKEMPNQYFNMGIAEQSTVSIAAGLALSGKTVYVYSIIPFITMRCFEQIRNDLCYQKLKVRVVGIGSGYSYGKAGMSHHGVEDISILRSLPNMTVVSPATKQELKDIMLTTKDHDGPMYIRLGKNSTESGSTGKKISFGKANKIDYSNSKVGLFVTGSIFDKALGLMDLLKKKGINADLVSFPFIKPIDKEFIIEESGKKDVIITIEENNIIGGLGSAVSEIVAESGKKVILKRLGINDTFHSIVGDRDYLLDLDGLSAEKMYDEISKLKEKFRGDSA